MSKDKPKRGDTRTVSYQNPDGAGWRGRKRWIAERQCFLWSGGEWGSYRWCDTAFAYSKTRDQALTKLQAKLDKARTESAKRADAKKARANAEKEAEDKARRIVDTSFEVATNQSSEDSA